jgi:thioredoxin-like negative regulator of GroEL
LVPAQWPIVADGDYDLSRQLNVVGWPTTIVVGTDGAEITRIAGGADSLSVRLLPYLELANKRIDLATLDRRLSPATQPSGATTKLLLDMQKSRHLLASGKAEDAYESLKQIIEANPDFVPARIAMVDAMIRAGRGPEAIDSLKALPLDAMPQNDRDLLAARALIAMSQWEDAQKILIDAVRHDPKLVDAHFLLGQVYEHANDWQNAAKEYRAIRELDSAK